MLFINLDLLVYLLLYIKSMFPQIVGKLINGETMKKIFLFLAISFLITSNVDASQIVFNSISGTGDYHNGLTPLTNNSFPNETESWSTNTTWWMGTSPQFTFLFDQMLVEEVTLSVDNNDSYQVQYTADGLIWSNLFDIKSTDGESKMGMDTMSSDSTDAEFISSIDFSSQTAVGLRVFATSGDNHYSVGEFQAFGTLVSSSVPEPTAILLFGIGLLGLAGVNRRKK